MIYSSDSHDISITERDKSKAKSIMLQFPYFILQNRRAFLHLFLEAASPSNAVAVSPHGLATLNLC